MITNVPLGFCVHCMTTYKYATTIPICGHTFCGKCLCSHFLKIIEVQDKYFTCPECLLDVDWTDEEVIEWVKTFESSNKDVINIEVRQELVTEDGIQNETIFVNDEQNVGEISFDKSSDRQEENTCETNEPESETLPTTEADKNNKFDQCENMNHDEEVTGWKTQTAINNEDSQHKTEDEMMKKSSINLEEEVTGEVNNSDHTRDLQNMKNNVDNPTKDNSSRNKKVAENTKNQAAEMYGQDKGQDIADMKRPTHGKSDKSGMDDLGIHSIPKYPSASAENLPEHNADFNEGKPLQTTVERSDNAIEENPSVDGDEITNKREMTPNPLIINDKSAVSDHKEVKQNTNKHGEEMDTHDDEQGKDDREGIAIQDANSIEEEMDVQESGPDVTQNKGGTENTKTQFETNDSGILAENSEKVQSGADQNSLHQSTINTGDQIQTTPGRVQEGMDSNYSTDSEKLDRNGNQVDISRTIQENHHEEVDNTAEGRSSESSSLYIIPDKFLKENCYSIILSKKCSPTFTGLTLFEEDTVILCDNCGHNDACGYLCLFNFENNYITKMEMNKPFGVCALVNSESMVAVSVPNDKMIYLVEVCNGWLKIVKSFDTKKEPLTLISLGNGQIGITWKCPPSFEIVDVSTEDMTQVRCYTRDSSGRRFKSFRYVAVDETRSHIIQPCHVDNAVYCFHFSGDLVFTYKDTRLRGPYGVDTDLHGLVYICSRLNDTIHIVSPSGTNLKIISENIPSCPQTIRFDKSGNRVWMTVFDRYDIVFLYTIEKKTRSAKCIAI